MHVIVSRLSQKGISFISSSLSAALAAINPIVFSPITLNNLLASFAGFILYFVSYRTVYWIATQSDLVAEPHYCGAPAASHTWETEPFLANDVFYAARTGRRPGRSGGPVAAPEGRRPFHITHALHATTLYAPYR